MSSPARPAAKRQRQVSPENVSPTSTEVATAADGSPLETEQASDGTKAAASEGGGGGAGGSSTSFRNVSACNRCRLRKNRCDQKLPSCASCAKAGVSCVGYDPITKREIPRRYVTVFRWSKYHCWTGASALSGRMT